MPYYCVNFYHMFPIILCVLLYFCLFYLILDYFSSTELFTSLLLFLIFYHKIWLNRIDLVFFQYKSTMTLCIICLRSKYFSFLSILQIPPNALFSVYSIMYVCYCYYFCETLILFLVIICEFNIELFWFEKYPYTLHPKHILRKDKCYEQFTSSAGHFVL